MSIKIYNGFKLNGLNAVQLMAWLKKFRAECEEYAYEDGRGMYLGALLRYYDKHAFQVESPTVNRTVFDNGLREAMYKNEIHPRVEDFDHIFRSHLNYHCELLLCAISNTKWLCMTFFECDELLERLKKHPEYEFYGYWNNTDRPEGTSVKQWIQCYDDWSTVMDTSWVPSQQMLSYQILPADYIQRFMRESYSTLTNAEITEANQHRYDAMFKTACGKAFYEENRGHITKMSPLSIRDGVAAKLADEHWEGRSQMHESIMAHISSHPVSKIVKY